MIVPGPFDFGLSLSPPWEGFPEAVVLLLIMLIAFVVGYLCSVHKADVYKPQARDMGNSQSVAEALDALLRQRDLKIGHFAFKKLC